MERWYSDCHFQNSFFKTTPQVTADACKDAAAKDGEWGGKTAGFNVTMPDQSRLRCDQCQWHDHYDDRYDDHYAIDIGVIVAWHCS
jgi:hypothetical protein